VLPAKELKVELRTRTREPATVEDREGGPDGYQLLAREFYLPYLSLMVNGRPSNSVSPNPRASQVITR